MNQLREILEYHGGMLSDGARTSAYARAIAQVVRPGDVVLDIGTGTGILALMSLRAGARRVYAMEAGRVAALARRVIDANDPEGRITLLEGHSTELSLPERADVLVSEILWNAGLGEGILATYADARDRLLNPDARIIPAEVTTWLAPVDSPRAHEAVSVWQDDLLGFDYSALQRIASDVAYRRAFRAEAAIAEPAALPAVDLTAPIERTYFSAEATFAASRAGTVHGLAGWFSSELAPGVTLKNTPPQGGSWMHAYLPIQTPVAVAEGDEIRVRVVVLSDDEVWQWTVQIGETTQKGSTLTPFLMGRTA